MSHKTIIFHGSFVHTIEGHLEILEDSYICVKEGKISSITKNKPDILYDEFVETTKTQFIIPGLIDTHIHAPQYTFAGCGLDLPLLEWLNTYTFPTEKKFSDLELAKNVYNKVVQRTLNYGTTTASYFATIDNCASLVLADICKEKGQRAFIGKVSMDRNSPSDYIEETNKAVENAREFINKLKKKKTKQHVHERNTKQEDDISEETQDNELVQPILTPRFVPTCSEKLMKGLSEIHKEDPSLLIQSHVSENKNEIQWVKELHPECQNYCDVYSHYGLLNKKTILAHGVHLTDEELVLLSKEKTSIAHCPSSNFQLFSGNCDIRRLQKANVNVSLGTDVAGGESVSMIHAMRNALLCSRSILFGKRDYDENNSSKVSCDYLPLSVAEVVHLATECGAKALGLDEKIGNFKVGKEFDALLVDMDAGSTDCFGSEKITDILDKFVHLADDRNIIRVYIQGKLVKIIK